MDKQHLVNKLIQRLSQELGLVEIEVVFQDESLFENEFIAAYFHQELYLIVIHMKWLAKVPLKEMTRVVAHEMRHAYQRAVVDYPDLLSHEETSDTIEVWKKEFSQHRVPGDSEEVSSIYQNQEIEKDADRFAEGYINKMFRNL